MNSFLSRENVDMLVEILLDDKPNKTQGDINQIIQEINVFRNTHLNSSAVSNVSLLELNQQFLKRMISHSLQSPSNSHSSNSHSSNTLQSPMSNNANMSLQSSGHNPSLQSPNTSLQSSNSSLQSSSSYRNEDLKAERLDFFDKQLNQKRQEFESAITLKKPVPPIFEDSKMLDKPISNMEELIAQTMAQRNFDISNISSPQSSDWLSPVSTSVKVEKQELNGQESKEKEKEKKTISFEEPPTTNSIFARLKTNNSLESQIEILTNRVTLLEEQIAELRSLIK
jgi:hypothetical protein